MQRIVTGSRSKLASRWAPIDLHSLLLHQSCIRFLSQQEIPEPPDKAKSNKRSSRLPSKPVKSSAAYTHLSFAQYLQEKAKQQQQPPASPSVTEDSLKHWQPPAFRDLLEKPVSNDIAARDVLQYFRGLVENGTTPTPEEFNKMLETLKEIDCFDLSVSGLLELLQLLVAQHCHISTHPAILIFIPRVYDYVSLLQTKQSRSPQLIIIKEEEVLAVLSLTASLGSSTTSLPRESSHLLPEITHALNLYSLLLKSPQQFREVWQVLASLHFNWSELPFKTRRELITAVSREEILAIVPGLSYTESVEMLQAVLAVMRGFERQLPVEVLSLTLNLAQQILSRYDHSHQTIRVIDSLLLLYSATDQIFSSLSNQQREVILAMIQSQWDDFNFLERCQLLAHLGEMKGDYRLLMTSHSSNSISSSSSQWWTTTCIESLRRDLTTTNTTVAINEMQYLFRGFFALNYHWEEMSIDFQSLLFTTLERVLRESLTNSNSNSNRSDYPFQFTNLLASLALMRSSTTIFPFKLHYLLLRVMDSFAEHQIVLHPHLVCHLFQGLANLGYRLREIPSSIQEKLFQDFSVALEEGLTEKELLMDFAIAVMSIEKDWRRDHHIRELLVSILEFVLSPSSRPSGSDSSISPSHSHSSISSSSNSNHKWFSRFATLITAMSRSTCQWRRDLPQEVVMPLQQNLRDYCLWLEKNQDYETLLALFRNLTRLEMPSEVLQETIGPTVERLLPSLVKREDLSLDQTRDILVLLSQLSYSWTSLSKRIKDGLRKNIHSKQNDCDLLTLGSILKSLALLSFDSFLPAIPFQTFHSLLLRRYVALTQHLNQHQNQNQRQSTSSSVMSNNEKSLLKEAESHLSYYFEWLRALPPNSLTLLLQYSQLDTVPVAVHHFSSDSTTNSNSQLTSRFQAQLEQDFDQIKKGAAKTLRFTAPFYGFRESRIYPIDLAITRDDHLIALIVINGSISYNSRQLQFLEYLYHKKYPEVPLLHYSINQEEADKQIVEYSQSLVEVLKPFL